MPLFPSIPRNGGMFLGSLLFATVLWLLFYLSRDFSLTLVVPLQIRDSLSVVKTEPGGLHSISIQVHGRGLLLSRYQKMKDQEPIRLSGNFKYRSSIKLRKYFTEINNQMPPGIGLVEILTDSLILNRVAEISKKVPLQIGFQVSFQKQFYFSNPARLYPDSVQISGPRFLITSIHSWKIPNIGWTGLNRTIDTSIHLTNSRLPEIRITPEYAKINIHIDRFTESLISLPIKILGNEEGQPITLIPSRVAVSYLVPLSYYNTVREELFEAEVDLTEWKKNPTIGSLKVNLIRYPDFIRIIKKNPVQVNFLLYK